MSTSIPPIADTNVELIPPYVPVFGPTPNITPFTYRDGVTYLQKLEGLVSYLNHVMVPWVQENYDDLAETFVEEINRLIEEMNAIIDAILNSAAGINDPIVAAIFENALSLTRAVTDELYGTETYDKLYGGYVNVKTFGAIGDGITDDTVAIQNADAHAVATNQGVYFPGGRYVASHLVINSAWNMDEAAILVYDGTNLTNFLSCTASNINSGSISIDFNGLSCQDGFSITGNHNRFTKITVKNMTSGLSGTIRGIYILGNDNVISEVIADDFINNDNGSNDSMPQPFVLSGNATRNVIDAVISNNVTATVVDNSTGANIIGRIFATNGTDNALYVVAAGNCSVGEIIYEGTNSSAGFRHGCLATVGKITHIGRVGAVGPAVFFGDCSNITIGEIVARGHYGPILKNNVAAAGRINIGSIKGTVVDAAPIFMPREDGDLEYLTIDRLDITATLSSTFGASTRSFLRFDAAKGINFGFFNFKIIGNGFLFPDPFYLRIRDALSYRSFVRFINVEFFQNDYKTEAPATFFGTGFGTVDGAFIQPLLEVNEGHISDDNKLRSSQYPFWQSGRLVRSLVPTTGTWRKGQLFWAEAPAAGHTMFLCTVAGTPGTWITV